MFWGASSIETSRVSNRLSMKSAERVLISQGRKLSLTKINKNSLVKSFHKLIFYNVIKLSAIINIFLCIRTYPSIFELLSAQGTPRVDHLFFFK